MTGREMSFSGYSWEEKYFMNCVRSNTEGFSIFK